MLFKTGVPASTEIAIVFPKSSLVAYLSVERLEYAVSK